MSPSTSHPLLRVAAHRVARFLGRDNIESDRARELFGAAQLCLVKTLTKNPKANVSYLVTAIDWAIVRHWQTDRQLAVPPSTRLDREARGEEPGDFASHSFGDVITGKGLTNESPVWWADGESQWFSPASAASELCEVTEYYELLFTLCRDDVDRAIVTARCDGLSLAILADDFQPVHVADVAAVIGISPETVQRRLDDLEARYYRWADRKLPTKRQRQQAPR